MNGDTSDSVWICLVCGYVHRGPNPPDSCPVCGAGASDFERHTESRPAAVKAPVRQWRCLICGYIHEGPEPPEECPVCGAGASEFEPGAETAPAPKTSGARVRIVIVGGGIAGLAAAEAARQASAGAEITLLSKEPDVPYYRLNLTRYLAGEVGEDALPVHPPAWYDEHRLRLRLGMYVEALALEEHAVLLNDGSREPFDKLIITCGAHAFLPPIPGVERPGVTALRSLADARRLIEAIRPGIACVCVGGGILGLEAAGGLAKRGAHVTVLENGDWLLPRQLNQTAAALLEQYVAKQGISVRHRAKTAEITGRVRAEGVRLADGVTVPADLVVIATGVRAESHLARKAGLTVNQGIVVDAHLTTLHPDVLAAGDVAEHQGTLYGLWEPARHQGAIAGMNAAGVVAEFGGLPRANTLKVLGVDMFSVGVVQPPDGSYEEIAEESGGCYYRFLFRDHHLSGAIFVGDTRLSASAANAIKTQTDFSGILRGRASVAGVIEHLRGKS